MKRIIPFSRYFVPAAALSVVLVVLGLIGVFHKDMGFNMGIDFQPGLLQEVQFAPTAFRLTYNGPGNASVFLTPRSHVDIVIAGAMVDEISHRFDFASYPTLADLARRLGELEGLVFMENAPLNIQSNWLIQSAQSSSRLDDTNPFALHYLPPGAASIDIADVRASLSTLGTVSVQVLGTPEERRFMIRMEDNELSADGGGEIVVSTLENSFGQGEVAVTRSDFVGSRFARQLSDQAIFLVTMTLLLILVYCSFRFKLQYALGAVIAIIHNGLITITFIVWSGMEFNTITIAAILTILGYSINDIVVVFDRLKETRRIYPDDSFVDVLNRAVSETLSRTIITTVTTIVAVASLYFFTTGAMKDFAAALIVGMVTGVYATIFIAMSFVLFWETQSQKRGKKKQALAQ